MAEGPGIGAGPLCGACGHIWPIAAYLADRDACPDCGHTLNPDCRRHHGLYFEASGEERTGAHGPSPDNR